MSMEKVTKIFFKKHYLSATTVADFNKQIHRQSVESVSFQHGTMEETGHETK